MKSDVFEKSMVFLAIVLFFGVIVIGLAADAKKLEKEYQRAWCAERGGEVEVVLPDRTRCDCLTATHAIEFEFAANWAESVGQSLYYSLQTGRRAGVVLILSDPRERKYLIRLNSTIVHFIAQRLRVEIESWLITRP